MAAPTASPSMKTARYARYPTAAISKEKERGQWAAIRNFLAEEALHPWLLFIDSNMQVIHPHYLTTYGQSEESDVIYGGYQIKRNDEKYQHNLRYILSVSVPRMLTTSSAKPIHTEISIPPTLW